MLVQKEEFLKELTSTGKQEYKRYIKSPIRYAGGKSRAVGLIISHFPNDIKRLISVFMGGGSVEIATARELGIEVIAFDIFDILVNFWQVGLERPNELIDELRKLKPIPEVYKIIREELKAHWDKKITLPPVRLARDYYFNFNLSYGPGFLGWASNVYLQENRYLKLIEKIRILENIPLKVECSSFEEVFRKYPNDFFYCDPPYYLEGNSKMFKGIYPQRNFPIHHKDFNHELLAELLHNHKGKFVLSYNDCDTIRRLYKGFKILQPKWQYTMGQGETRIGRNRINSGNNYIKESHELLIIKE